MTYRIPALLAAALAFVACGARTTEELVDGGRTSGGSSGGSSGSGSSSSSGTPGPGDASPVVDANTFTDVVQPIVCQGAGGEGSGGNGSCSLMQSETCSDGNTYNISCSCPGATCSCYQTTASGGGSGGFGVSYSGCPTCDPSSAPWSLCGFPGQ